MREVIKETFLEVLDLTGAQLAVPKLDDEIVLLETGLDSLGFATLVAILEEKLGFDPFVQMETPIYPSTFGQFVSIYEKKDD